MIALALKVKQYIIACHQQTMEVSVLVSIYLYYGGNAKYKN